MKALLAQAWPVTREYGHIAKTKIQSKLHASF